MMPKMDGIEATKIIRDMGYSHYIVALTANAVAGQAEIFLGSGFDDFISKPIDVRQLNNVLNKLVRDKQPPEVIEAAQKQAEAKKEQLIESELKSGVDPQFAKLFVQDANKSLSVLDEINKKGEYDDEDLRTYVIHTHGMKSALANIGIMDLSAIALKLEMLGRDANIEVIISETPKFLDSLRLITEKLTPKDESGISDKKDEDPVHLREELLAIKATCEEYDETTAEKIIAELKLKTWSQATSEMLDAISEHLFLSDFDEAVNVIDKFLKG
jgi:YesN/AraC family two-component response regulator